MSAGGVIGSSSLAAAACALALALAASGAAEAQPAPPAPTADTAGDRACVYRHGRDVCKPFACVPADAADFAQPLQQMIPQNAPGWCGKCRFDPKRPSLGRADCAGAACNPDGTCAIYEPSPGPVSIWPTYHLLVADVSFAIGQGSDYGPTVGAGYLFQGALSKTPPRADPAKGYLTTDVPHWYFDVGASAAFAAGSQSAFGNLGLTYYAPAMPSPLTTVSLEAIYERVGPKLWDGSGSDRAGAGLQLGFLQNIFLRGAFVHTVHGPYHSNAVLVSVIYMKDLLGDLIPDRFQKYVPKGL